MVVYDKGWQAVGDKASLGPRLSEITGVDLGVLHGILSLSDVPVGLRMSWAAERRTTRVEDMAYSLLGIFDVHMPLLYGEGLKLLHPNQIPFLECSRGNTCHRVHAIQEVINPIQHLTSHDDDSNSRDCPLKDNLHIKCS